MQVQQSGHQVLLCWLPEESRLDMVGGQNSFFSDHFGQQEVKQKGISRGFRPFGRLFWYPLKSFDIYTYFLDSNTPHPADYAAANDLAFCSLAHVYAKWTSGLGHTGPKKVFANFSVGANLLQCGHAHTFWNIGWKKSQDAFCVPILPFWQKLQNTCFEKSWTASTSPNPECVPVRFLSKTFRDLNLENLLPVEFTWHSYLPFLGSMLLLLLFLCPVCVQLKCTQHSISFLLLSCVLRKDNLLTGIPCENFGLGSGK